MKIYSIQLIVTQSKKDFDRTVLEIHDSDDTSVSLKNIREMTQKLLLEDSNIEEGFFIIKGL